VDADELLVPWSTITVHGDGFLQPPAGRTILRLEGTASGRAVSAEISPEQGNAAQLRVLVDRELMAVFGELGGTFVGDLTAEVRQDEESSAESEPFPVELHFAPALQPRLDAVDAESVAPGELLGIRGDGIIDGPEGLTELVVAGRFEPVESGGFRVRDAPMNLASRLGRTSAAVYLRPAVLGLDAGRFEGEAWLRVTDAAGTRRRSGAVPLAFDQVPPRIDELTPRRGGRGQLLRVRGAGFLPNDAAQQTATIVRAVGTFSPHTGEAFAVEVPLIPERWIDNRELLLPLRTRFDEGQIVGLVATPGVFTGVLRAELIAGRGRVLSAAYDLRFEVERPVQQVFLKYLPGFVEALEAFGLAAAEAEIRARILAVCRRDYAGLRVYFGEQIPTEWVEYTTVEVGGRDPAGRLDFGLDNTPGKDTGNLRLDDVLGGVNADTERECRRRDDGRRCGPVFGGVFVSSFLALSPSAADPIRTLADPRFDEVFAPFAPALAGDAEPLRAGEAAAPERAAQRERALSALANLVGSTISHEVGHALGLAAGAGANPHNPRPTEGGLMDAGSDRPFVERAALDGRPPSRFLGPNRDYLDTLFGLAR